MGLALTFQPMQKYEISQGERVVSYKLSVSVLCPADVSTAGQLQLHLQLTINIDGD